MRGESWAAERAARKYLRCHRVCPRLLNKYWYRANDPRYANVSPKGWENERALDMYLRFMAYILDFEETRGFRLSDEVRYRVQHRLPPKGLKIRRWAAPTKAGGPRKKRDGNGRFATQNQNQETK